MTDYSKMEIFRPRGFSEEWAAEVERFLESEGCPMEAVWAACLCGRSLDDCMRMRDRMRAFVEGRFRWRDLADAIHQRHIDEVSPSKVEWFLGKVDEEEARHLLSPEQVDIIRRLTERQAAPASTYRERNLETFGPEKLAHLHSLWAQAIESEVLRDEVIGRLSVARHGVDLAQEVMAPLFLDKRACFKGISTTEIVGWIRETMVRPLGESTLKREVGAVRPKRR